MKVGSIELYAYLLESGALNGTPEEIDRAKFEYRRLYKRRWKRSAAKRNEVRFEVTEKQLVALKAKAVEHGQRHTTYARSIILSAVESMHFIAHQDRLLKALQLIGMATIATAKHTMSLAEVSVLLEQAEAILIKYLNS